MIDKMRELGLPLEHSRWKQVWLFTRLMKHHVDGELTARSSETSRSRSGFGSGPNRSDSEC